jgi:hypothetical protein
LPAVNGIPHPLLRAAGTAAALESSHFNGRALSAL